MIPLPFYKNFGGGKCPPPQLLYCNKASFANSHLGMCYELRLTYLTFESFNFIINYQINFSNNRKLTEIIPITKNESLSEFVFDTAKILSVDVKDGGKNLVLKPRSINNQFTD